MRYVFKVKIAISTLKCLPDCGCKIMPVEGLLEKVHSLAKDTMRLDDVGDVPGNKQAIDVRGDGKQVFCKVAAVHLRHDHIGHQQIN